MSISATVSYGYHFAHTPDATSPIPPDLLVAYVASSHKEERLLLSLTWEWENNDSSSKCGFALLDWDLCEMAGFNVPKAVWSTLCQQCTSMATLQTLQLEDHTVE
jgi:hypothetical protein